MSRNAAPIASLSTLLAATTSSSVAAGTLSRRRVTSLLQRSSMSASTACRAALFASMLRSCQLGPFSALPFFMKRPNSPVSMSPRPDESASMAFHEPMSASVLMSAC